MTPERPTGTRFWALGAIVEIFERAGTRRAVVVLDSGAAIEVALDCGRDVHLGDRVSVEGTIAIEGVAAPSIPAATGLTISRRVADDEFLARHWSGS